MIKKLKQQCGETLIETMVSLLIAVLSMGILSSAVLAANNLNKARREKDNIYKQKLESAESMDSFETNEGKLHIVFDTLVIDGSSSITVDVDIYGGEENEFVSYQEIRLEDTP